MKSINALLTKKKRQWEIAGTTDSINAGLFPFFFHPLLHCFDLYFIRGPCCIACLSLFVFYIYVSISNLSIEEKKTKSKRHISISVHRKKQTEIPTNLTLNNRVDGETSENCRPHSTNQFLLMLQIFFSTSLAVQWNFRRDTLIMLLENVYLKRT